MKNKFNKLTHFSIFSILSIFLIGCNAFYADTITGKFETISGKYKWEGWVSCFLDDSYKENKTLTLILAENGTFSFDKSKFCDEENSLDRSSKGIYKVQSDSLQLYYYDQISPEITVKRIENNTNYSHLTFYIKAEDETTNMEEKIIKISLITKSGNSVNGDNDFNVQNDTIIKFKSDSISISFSEFQKVESIFITAKNFVGNNTGSFIEYSKGFDYKINVLMHKNPDSFKEYEGSANVKGETIIIKSRNILSMSNEINLVRDTLFNSNKGDNK